MKRLLVALVFLASSAYGEIYTWTDSRGIAHYTNSMYEVPGRYRDKVKVLDLGVERKGDASAPPQGGQAQVVRPAEQSPVPPADETSVRQSAPTQPPAVQPEVLRQRRSRRR
ncbi:MAG TPA: DUF4124 domain-containing protein [Geobacteraceae bacterium]